MIVKKRLRHNTRKDDFIIVLVDDENKNMFTFIDDKVQKKGLSAGTLSDLNYKKTMAEYSVDKVFQEGE